jgi:hypothetical protein
MPTTKTRENDWSRETSSDHVPVTAAWLNDPTLKSNRAGKRRSTGLIDTKGSSRRMRLSVLGSRALRERVTMGL